MENHIKCAHSFAFTTSSSSNIFIFESILTLSTRVLLTCKVNIYFDVAGQMAVAEDAEEVVWGRDAWVTGAHSMFIGSAHQTPFAPGPDGAPQPFIDWG